jgi:riboflavin kinase/FMN adenylyltransferase
MAWHPGIVNVGCRPTFGGEEVTIEAHLFDFHSDLYGQNLRIAFVEYIRPEKKFSGIEEIKKQINTDCVMARGILKTLNANDITMPQTS